jgi:hypothetical protein
VNNKWQNTVDMIAQADAVFPGPNRAGRSDVTPKRAAPGSRSAQCAQRLIRTARWSFTGKCLIHCLILPNFYLIQFKKN